MSSYHNQAIAYRPEIDGLRAIAVLPVILFHAGFELFSGGYVGVDVFFVISGYLITSIILREMEQGKFSIVRFYERRARRILPALFFVIACCLPFAWMWMLPDELKRFGQSLVAVATFSSNIYFWRTTDYFAPAAEEQPLLHTWSLAVEEQYYVLFPLFLMLCWRFGKSKVFWLTTTMALLSILLAEWSWRNQPIANFYLLPTRAWELLAGSLIAFIPRDLAEKAKTHKASQIYSAAGLLMIVYSILFFDSDTPFPSAYAIVPVLGSVILIVYTNGTGVVGSFLASKSLVGIGLISYSAYLWHQPIFAFLRLKSLDHPSQVEFAIGALASLALAYLTWRLVEQPTRAMKVSQSSVLKFASLGLVVTIAVGLTNHVSNGFPTRYAHVDLPEKWGEKVICHGRADVAIYENAFAACLGEAANNSPGDYFLLGDSHAAQLTFPFKQIAETKGVNLGFINTESNESLPNALWGLELSLFKKLTLIEHLLLLADRGDNVVITFHRGHLNEHRDEHLLLSDSVSETEKEMRASKNLQYLIEILSQKGIKIFLIQDVPLLKSKAIVRCLLQDEWNKNTCGVDRAQDSHTRKRMDRIFQKAQSDYPDSVVFIELSDYFFGESDRYIAQGQNLKPTYVDDNHVTEAEALRLCSFLAEKLSLQNQPVCSSAT